MKHLGIVVMILATVMLGGCNPKGMVSTNQEIDIGKQSAKEIESKYGTVKDTQLNDMVNTMGQALAKCSDRPDLVYTFKILDQKDVNAVSLPGGWVYIYKGLIDETKDKPDQLAGVIAHEIGHIAARHHAQMLGRELQAQILIGTLTKGDTQKVAGIFANVQLLRWSRVQEFEADKLGVKYMYRCQRWNAQGLVDFFGTLLKIQKNHPSKFEQIFLTHPVTDERIKRAQEYLDALKAGTEKP